MKLEEVNDLFETTDCTEANKYLDRGYHLVRIFNQRDIVNDKESTTVVYVLGRS